MSGPSRVDALPIRFGPDGLVPTVVQDAETGAVLMTAFMNAEALAATRATGRVHFWSRSRGKLWRKGETSGHEQIVEDIYVNCERNSLLVTVHQLGAVCHDGYPTCYYRRLEPDGTLTTVHERAFDPAAVYNRPAEVSADLVAPTRLLYGAYAYLRDHDLAEVSGTSARLRSSSDTVRGRVADELGELAGALDGTHRHTGLADDVRLEGAQVLYWVILAALRAGLTWEQIRPDRALLTGDDELSPAVAAKLLRAEAEGWATPESGDLAARCHATLALVGQACRAAAVSPGALVEADLAALRAKPYLADYFARHTPPGPRS